MSSATMICMQKTDYDMAVRPQDDFFGYVNNKWLAANPIPASESTWGTFYVLRDKAVKAVHDILQELSRTDSAELSHDQKLLKTFFESAMNFDTNHVKHLATLKGELAKIDAITTPNKLAGYLGYAHRASYSSFWADYVSLDDKDSGREALRFYQAGLSLPNRDYYLDKSENMAKVRSEYAKFYEQVRTLLPDVTPDDWQSIYQLELKIAEASWTNVELRDVQKNYSKLTLEELSDRLKDFCWSSYFTGLGWEQPTGYVIVDQLSFIKTCVKLLKDTPLENVKSYLKWHVINHSLSWLSQATSQLNFDFYGQILSGVKEQKELWKRASALIDNTVIGEALGREYATRHFPEASKAILIDLIEEIRRAYHQRIDRLTWMKQPTKLRAHTKLDNLKVFVGYPSVWKDLSKLNFTDNILDNLLAARIFRTNLDLAKVGQPPRLEDWEMNAHTVNAYHHPNRLEIVFPAAILQPPFFDPQASRATNLGGIGAVIGHELTHGFDDQGSEFDKFGNSNPWQTEDERKAFMNLAENIIRLADFYETVPGTFLQGHLILGEAIADVGGLELAVEALTLGAHTPDDLVELFVNFARCECGQATPERLVELAKVDPHPPSAFRVNCVVNHVDAFYDSYNLTASDKLYLPPEQRAQIW